LEILEQDRAQLDEPQRGLASGDDGVHAGAIAVVGTDTTVAVTVEGGRIAAVPAIALARDEIDERGFLGLLHGLPPIATLGAHKRGGLGDLPGGRTRSGIGGLAQYRRPNTTGQEGSWVYGPKSAIVPQCESVSGGYGDSPDTKYTARAPSSWTMASTRATGSRSSGLVRVGEP